MLTARLILERFDKDNRLIEKRDQPSRSFVSQFIELLYVAHAQITVFAPYVMTDVGGNPRDLDSSGDGDREYKANLMVGSPPGNSQVITPIGRDLDDRFDWDKVHNEGQNIGIQVGTGAGAVTPTDIAMGTRIVHGSGMGELEYGGCEFLSIAFADPNGQFTIRRYFTNNSGGGITVEEVGIYAIGSHCDVAAGGNWPFCIARDLTGGIAVLDTELLRATYVVQITV